MAIFGNNPYLVKTMVAGSTEEELRLKMIINNLVHNHQFHYDPIIPSGEDGFMSSYIIDVKMHKPIADILGDLTVEEFLQQNQFIKVE